MSKPKYYISTAIAYTSSRPHIGNTYEIVLADSIARYKRMEGYDVYFQTGTDEHGQKIEEKANAAGITPKEYVDNVAKIVKANWDVMNTPTINSSAPRTITTKSRYKRSLKSSTSRAIFIRATTRACTARRANPSSRLLSLTKTAAARTVTVR